MGWKTNNYSFYIINSSLKRYLGGYSSGVPPLPIPNREVKPTRADGTALHRGRVGRRRFSETSKIKFFGVSLFYIVISRWFTVDSQQSAFGVFPHGVSFSLTECIEIYRYAIVYLPQITQISQICIIYYWCPIKKVKE